MYMTTGYMPSVEFTLYMTTGYMPSAVVTVVKYMEWLMYFNHCFSKPCTFLIKVELCLRIVGVIS